MSNFHDKDCRLLCDMEAFHRNELTGEVEQPGEFVDEILDISP